MRIWIVFHIVLCIVIRIQREVVGKQTFRTHCARFLEEIIVRISWIVIDASLELEHADREDRCLTMAKAFVDSVQCLINDESAFWRRAKAVVDARKRTICSYPRAFYPVLWSFRSFSSASLFWPRLAYIFISCKKEHESKALLAILYSAISRFNRYALRRRCSLHSTFLGISLPLQFSLHRFCFVLTCISLCCQAPIFSTWAPARE